MANNTSRMIVTDLDPDTIKANFIEYLQGQDQFRDYNFEGSGMNILLDILAYNTHYNAYYTNMAINEAFADTALLKDSIISKAKELGYTPRSRSAAIAYVSMNVATPVLDTSTTQTLPKYAKFLSSTIDGTNYVFTTLEDTTVTRTNTALPYQYSNIALYQGRVFSYTFDGVDLDTNPTLRFELPDTGIDSSTLVVSVRQSSSNLTSTIYQKSDDINELTPNSLIYFVESAKGDKYTVQFGDGIIGKKLENGNLVTIKYLVTDGVLANDADRFTYYSGSGIVDGSTYTLTTISAAAGGANEPGIEEIRFNALFGYSAQNRAVTASDYEILLYQDYPQVEAISVWGGQDNDPPVYGYVFVSMKPRDGFTISATEKERIANEIISKRNMVTVLPKIVDPDYTYIRCAPMVHYDSRKTTLSVEELKTLVRNAIINYASSQLNQFSAPVRTSELERSIVNAHECFLGCDLDLILESHLEIQPGINANYTIQFPGKLSHVHGGGKGSGIYASPAFNILDNNGVQRLAYFEETPGSDTGIDSINVVLPGENYSDNPTVTITGDAPTETVATATATVVNGKIISINLVQRGAGYSFAEITITDTTGDGATATPVLAALRGTIRSYYFADGKKVILNANAGNIEYDSGTITLANFKPISLDGTTGLSTLKFIARSGSKTITPQRNAILTLNELDPTSIQVSLVKEI